MKGLFVAILILGVAPSLSAQSNLTELQDVFKYLNNRTPQQDTSVDPNMSQSGENSQNANALDAGKYPFNVSLFDETTPASSSPSESTPEKSRP